MHVPRYLLFNIVSIFHRDEEGKCPVQVGIVTFDKALHFYNVLVSKVNDINSL